MLQEGGGYSAIVQIPAGVVSEASPTRLFVVDCDPLVRCALRMMMDRAPGVVVVGEAADGTGVLPGLERTPADVVLMAVRMPRVNGIAAIPPIRSRYPRMRIVLMTAYNAERWEPHVFAAGADAFVPKSASVQTIVDAVMGWRPPDAGAAGCRLPSLPRLSARECEVGRRIALGQSNDQIAHSLGVSVNTVKTYGSRLFTKLGVVNRVQLANLLNGVPIQRPSGTEPSHSRHALRAS